MPRPEIQGVDVPYGGLLIGKGDWSFECNICFLRETGKDRKIPIGWALSTKYVEKDDRTIPITLCLACKD